MRLIDVDALDFTIPKNPHFMTETLVQVLKNAIDKAPTIDPESLRPQGEWIKDEHGALYCNICGNGAEERFGEQCETPYCNNCGAVMKNGGEPVDYKSLYPWLQLRCTMNDKDKLAKATVWLLISLVMLAIAVAAWAQIK